VSGLLLRNQRVASLATLLADPVVFPGTSYGVTVKQVIAHGGEWSDEERAKYFSQVPTVVVSCLGSSPTDYIEESGGAVRPAYAMSCVVVARDVVNDGGSGRFHRSDVAQAIAEKIAGHIFFDRDEVAASDGAISRFRMEIAWASLRDNRDVGMWILYWEERGAIANVDAASLPDFIECRTTYAMGDEDTPDVEGRAVVNPDGEDTEA
jgi:hypothetical protein